MGKRIAEDEYDLQIYEKALREFSKDPTTFSLEEAEREIGAASKKQDVTDPDGDYQEPLWQDFVEGLEGFTDDIFEDGRDQGIQDERDGTADAINNPCEEAR